MLAAKNDGQMNKTSMTIGTFYRAQIEGKYQNRVDIRTSLLGNIRFIEALKEECEVNRTLANTHQLHFHPSIVKDGAIQQLETETGVYMSFEQLLKDQPSILAQKNFLDDTFKALIEITDFLHSKGIKHVCYSPSSVLVRKGDYHVMLLSHGSYYLGISDLQTFFGDDVKYVAPEVLQHGSIDERCDVYSIGCFMKSLLAVTDMPLEYRKVIKKAVSEMPEDRYNTPNDMLKAIKTRRVTFRSAIALTGALVFALVCLGLYYDMTPKDVAVEFVKPAPRQATDDLIDDGFSPEELGVVSADSVQDEDVAQQREYQAKAEEIFRKKYEKEADRILSKIYNKDYMSKSEKKFMAESQSTIKELMDLQASMGEEASLTPERAQLIASGIIERLTNEKKKALGDKMLGIQK